MTPPTVRMVCFDWGGVILRICRSWAEGCAAASLPVRGEVAAPELIGARKAVHALYQNGRIPCDEFFDRIAATMDGRYSPAEVRRIHDAWLLGEYPGVDRLVDDLHTLKNVRTGMLSNTNHSHWSRQSPAPGLPHFPTAARLHCRHASHVLGLSKPGTEIYGAFEHETGEAPAAILFFDDLAENIDAARARGWRAEQIDFTGDTAAQMRTHLRTYGVM